MTISKSLLAAGLAACIALPGAAFAQPAPDEDAPVAQDAGRPGTPPRFGPGYPPPPEFGPGRHGEHRPPSPLWETAERLSAAETALGITPEQASAWRDFATALIAFGEAGRPDHPAPDADRAAPPAPDAGPAGEAGDNNGELRGVQMFERFIQSRIRQGEAATKLSGALDALAKVLTPEQKRIADRLLAELPHPGPHHGPHHGRPEGGPPPHPER